jgi:putative spermidine/putrescine transport system substrate-binding protein
MKYPNRQRMRLAAAAGAVALALTACGGSSGHGSGSSTLDVQNWASVLAQAKGQTVNWYMYGGDTVLNTFVSGYVADQLRDSGVTLKQVKITDTVDAVNAVLAQKQAGKNSGGSVDAIWINGENFATGAQAKLWDCGWTQSLPNATYVDFTNPAVANDFGVPVDGCEAVWQQSNSALVYDSAQLGSADVASVSSLLAWAAAHPGHLTYPALPDFTGSMAVRTILYDTIGGPSSLAGSFQESTYAPKAAQLWPRLNSIEASLWRGGATYPASQDAVERLYSDGEISAFFTYGPGAVGPKVDQGLYPRTTREAVLAGGNIGNNSFLSIPYNAAHKAGALVLANVLQDPQTQLALYRTQGIYPGIDLAKVDPGTRAQFAAVPVNPSVLPLAVLTRDVQPELASGYVTRIEADWKINVLQK